MVSAVHKNMHLAFTDAPWLQAMFAAIILVAYMRV